MKHLPITLGFLLITLSCFAGGPWATGKGNGYYQLGFTSKGWNGRYAGTYAATIPRDFHRRVTESSLGFFGEYGLTDQLTLGIDAYLRQQSTSEELRNPEQNPFDEVLYSGELMGLGNPGILLKYQIPKMPIALSFYGRWQPNVAARDASIGLQTDFDAHAYSAGVLFGNGYDKSYWSADIGFSARSNQYSEQIQGNIQYGFLVMKNVYAIVDVNYVVSMENGQHDDGNYAQTATFIDNQGFLAYGPKIYAKVHENFSFNVAAYSGLAVVNQGNQPRGIFAAIAYEIDK